MINEIKAVTLNTFYVQDVDRIISFLCQPQVFLVCYHMLLCSTQTGINLSFLSVDQIFINTLNTFSLILEVFRIQVLFSLHYPTLNLSLTLTSGLRIDILPGTLNHILAQFIRADFQL